ncbi:alpha/beta fold hydrolase [Dokdonia ponticola]|uniref:Alpha/beta fold hydrolase n=1 Tax=Dokdonia ponticola TaxID=2041041 RepID=A0ABV9HYV7_9FLAO
MKPSIQYTKSGNINIAYQVFGSGSIDLVYIPGWVSNIDWMWACPELVNFFQELGKVARVILFDKRGTGLSDRVVEISTLEERMEDIKAVMDATGSEKAVLFGHSEGGSVSALFSATYPNRVLALTAFGIFAKRRYSENYPWAPTDVERQKVYDMIEHSWGSGQMNLETLAPSKANDPQFMGWLASYFRSGASPQAAMQLTKMNTQVNIIDILEYIKVPTLLMQRTHDIDVKIEEGRFIAKHIKGAKFVEFDGDDHLFWAGNTQEVLDEIKDFIQELPPSNEPKKGLITILFGKVIATSLGRTNSTAIKQCIARQSGVLLDIDNERFIAGFKVPGKAVQSGLDILDSFQYQNSHIHLGLYVKEECLDGGYKIDKRDMYMYHTLLPHSVSSSLIVTQTIKHLLSGSEFHFSEESSMLRYNSGSLCKLYQVNNTHAVENTPMVGHSTSFSKYDSFLEDLIKIIDEHIDNSSFGVEMLTKSLGMSERQLQRKVKEATGKSPGQLITCTRLSKAKEALTHRRYTVSEIAFLCGFSSPSYFTKCFKKEFGFTPTGIAIS